MVVILPTTLLIYRSAIYPHGMTFKYGLGGRLASKIKLLSKTKHRLVDGVF